MIAHEQTVEMKYMKKVTMLSDLSVYAFIKKQVNKFDKQFDLDIYSAILTVTRKP